MRQRKARSAPSRRSLPNQLMVVIGYSDRRGEQMTRVLKLKCVIAAVIAIFGYVPEAAARIAPYYDCTGQSGKVRIWLYTANRIGMDVRNYGYPAFFSAVIVPTGNIDGPFGATWRAPFPGVHFPLPITWRYDGAGHLIAGDNPWPFGTLLAIYTCQRTRW
jgi:hypothetical protein